jgi:hypothetical protein
MSLSDGDALPLARNWLIHALTGKAGEYTSKATFIRSRKRPFRRKRGQGASVKPLPPFSSKWTLPGTNECGFAGVQVTSKTVNVMEAARAMGRNRRPTS